MKNFEIKKIGIIGGNGAMGKFYESFFEKKGFEVKISFLGSKISNIELAKISDLILISVPINKTLDVIKEIGDNLEGKFLADITSLKQKQLQAMLKTNAREILGIHPMHGPSAGIKGQVYVFCRGKGDFLFNFFEKIFSLEGAIIQEITAEKHDDIMAVIQGLVHFSDIALAKTLEKLDIDLDEYMKFQSPAYKLKLDMMGRILYQDADLYGNIQIENEKNTFVIEKFLESSKELLEINKKKDLEGFKKYFNNTKKYLGDFAKKSMEESNKIIKIFFS